MNQEIKVSKELITMLGQHFGAMPLIQLYDRLNQEVVPQLVPKQIEEPKAEPINIDAKDLVSVEPTKPCACGEELCDGHDDCDCNE